MGGGETYVSFCKIEVKSCRFGIAFLPLNLIASIGGMSEWSMMMKGIDWRISYSLFLFGMVVFGWGIWIFTKKVIDKVSTPSQKGAPAPPME